MPRVFSTRLADVVKNKITTKTKYGLWSVTLSNESLFTVSRPRRHGYGGKFKQAVRRRNQGIAKNYILYVKLNSCSLTFDCCMPVAQLPRWLVLFRYCMFYCKYKLLLRLFSKFNDLDLYIIPLFFSVDKKELQKWYGFVFFF